MHSELLSPEVRAFLKEPRFGVLATINRDAMPQQTVMWYELQGDQVMMNTAAGRLKSNNLLRDRRISLCVSDGYRFVTLTGQVALNDDQTVAQDDIARLAYRYRGGDGAEMIPVFRRQHRVTLRMPIARVYVHGF